MTTGTVVLLLLAMISWGLLQLMLGSVVGVVAPGDQDIFLGLRWVLVWVLVAATWLWLSWGLLVAGGHPGLWPAWVNVAALLLVPLSGAAALAAVYLVSQTPLRWPLAIPAVVPLLLAAYLVSLYWPALRLAIAPGFHYVVWGLVCVLGLSIWPGLAKQQHEAALTRVLHERMLKEYEAKEDHERQAANRRKLDAMTPEQHLVDWYSLLEPDSGVRAEAIAALRKVPRRQGDVEEGLAHGVPVVMRLVPELDLQPTPALCAAAQVFLRKLAMSNQLRDREPYPFEAGTSIEISLPGIHWFQEHGCRCDEALTELESVVRSYLDSPARQHTLTSLAALRQAQPQ